MNNKHFIPQNFVDVHKFSKQAPITGVFLIVSDDTGYMAGTEGNVLQVECPSGTQAMANDLLTKAQGYQYQGYESPATKIPLDAELGDGVNVGGFYGLLADQTLEFGGGDLSDISAPGDDEVDHAYPYVSREQREVNRKIAETRAQLTVGLDEIKSEVSGISKAFVEDWGAKKNYYVGDIVKYTDGKYYECVLDHVSTSATRHPPNAKYWKEITNVDVGKSAKSMIQQNLNQISLSVQEGDDGAELVITKDGVKILGSVLVDGQFVAKSVSAKNIDGGIVNISEDAYFLVPAEDEDGDYVYDSDGNLVYTNAGYISSSDSGGIEIYSYKGAGLKSRFGSQVIAGESGVTLRDADRNNIRFYDGDFYPEKSSSHLGISSNPWRGVYANTGEILTSDRKKKTDISYNNDKYSAFFDRLKPCNYKMVDGTSGRTHTGFISQDVEESLNDCGIDSKEFAGFIRDKENDTYALRYEEFISLCVDQIQKLKKRVEELEEKLNG